MSACAFGRPIDSVESVLRGRQMGHLSLYDSYGKQPYLFVWLSGLSQLSGNIGCAQQVMAAWSK